MDKMLNAGRSVMHEVEVNIYFKGHMEKAKMNMYNIRKINVILGMLWLVFYNPQIDWKTEEIK